MPQMRPLPSSAFACLAGALLFAGACAPKPNLATGTLEPRDFVSAPAEAPTAAAPAPAEPPLSAAVETEEAGAADSEPVVTAPSQPEEQPPAQVAPAQDAPPPAVSSPRLLVLASEPDLTSAADVAPSEAAAVVAALIGQINGRPIFAQEVLDPIDARLRAAAREVVEGRETTAYFQQEAADAITRRLRDIVTNEVYLSEAETAIPDEQRIQALDYYRQLVRQQFISEQGQGSVEAAERWARETHEQSLDEHVETVLRSELIGLQVRQEVYARVIVSWREIETAYRDQWERFHPQPFARVRVLVISSAAQEQVQQIEAALAEGRTLAELIEAGEVTPLLFKDEQGLFQVPLAEANVEDLTLFEQDVYQPLNAAARRLEPGETSDAVPFNEGRLVGWVTLEAVEAPPAVPLYEAQQALRAEITERKRLRQFQHFEDTLLTRQDLTNMRVMAEMVLNIARREYLPR